MVRRGQEEAARLQRRLCEQEETITAARDHNCALHGRTKTLRRAACRLALHAWRAVLGSSAHRLRVRRNTRRAAALSSVLAAWRARASASSDGAPAAQHAARVLVAYKHHALLLQALTRWARLAAHHHGLIPARLPPARPHPLHSAGSKGDREGDVRRRRAVAAAAREWVEWQRVMSFEQRFLAQEGIRWINGLGLRAFSVWRATV